MTNQIERLRQSSLELCRNLNPKAIRRAAVASAASALRRGVKLGMHPNHAAGCALRLANDAIFRAVAKYGMQIEPLQISVLLRYARLYA